jgi:hypothetical protein
LKLRLNKFVVVAGVPGTVSRDLTAAANQFVLLGNHSTFTSHPAPTMPGPGQIPAHMQVSQAALEPNDPQFLQFLDYIDRHWAWRTIIGVSNFIGDPYNHKNRFRGRLTRESARDLLQTCAQQGILLLSTDNEGNEDLRLNRSHPVVIEALANAAQQSPSMSTSSAGGYGQWNQPQQQSIYNPSQNVTNGAGYPRRTTSIMSNLMENSQPMGSADDGDLDEDNMEEIDMEEESEE